MKSSFHSLIHFLPLFCNCQFRKLYWIQFLLSWQAGVSKLDAPLSITVLYSVVSKSKSESKSHCDWRSVNQYVLVSSPIWGSWPDIYYSLTSTMFFFSGAPSLTGGRVSLLYVLLALASVDFLGSEFRGTRVHILSSQIWDFPFRRLLRFTRSRWRYSKSPVSFYNSSEPTTQKTASIVKEVCLVFRYLAIFCCTRTLRRNMFTESLPSNGYTRHSIMILWDMTPCNLVESFERFQKKPAASILKMERVVHKFLNCNSILLFFNLKYLQSALSCRRAFFCLCIAYMFTWI
jgi:hypothetical protein